MFERRKQANLTNSGKKKKKKNDLIDYFIYLSIHYLFLSFAFLFPLYYCYFLLLIGGHIKHI